MMKQVLRYASNAAPVLALVVLAGLAIKSYPAAAQDDNAQVVPPPAVDAPAGQSTSAVAVLAGGCFWGVQGVFQHVKGVTNAVSGYAGGNAQGADYQSVSTGATGHAESVQVTYDPREISYGRLLQIFFSVVHDPTELNRQGPDEGRQYRSAIFPANPEQAEVAKAYIAQLDRARVFKKAIATKIEPGKAFYPAEAYHQDFLTRNPRSAYIVINDLPKIEDLKHLFPELYRASPALVARNRPSNN